jgi:hypothetical protein
MNFCNDPEVGQTSGHHCIGEHGHSGPHWCLLGHVWTADEEEEG